MTEKEVKLFFISIHASREGSDPPGSTERLI